LLGKFENFPEIVHKEKEFKTKFSVKELQKKIIKSLYSLNRKEIRQNSITNSISSDYIVIFELGIADGINFNYLDASELKRCLNFLKSRNFKTLDFFMVNRYYKIKSGKGRTPLKFDYQFLRFTFPSRCLKIMIYHERGPRRIPLDELISFLAKQIL